MPHFKSLVCTDYKNKATVNDIHVSGQDFSYNKCGQAVTH